MSDVKVLDCTLRDGGYCNEWNFGEANIKRITESLTKTGVDIIECGFLTNKVTYNTNITRFTKIEQINDIIPYDRSNSLYVCMVNYGEYSVSDLPAFSENTVDGIRVAFHKKDMLSAIEVCKQIKAKGYKVFVQAMVSLSYSDEEFLDLIHRCNEFDPYAFYIVDSFGVMKRKDLIRLFYLVEHNLSADVWIGYHSHNNMQLAYSNAQSLVDIKTKRNLIIDSSIYGMGRGAGNLNTELFVEYLNDNIGTDYLLHPILEVIDGILSKFYSRNPWGYSLPNYLSASHNAHPNYADYLNGKQTLTMENINDLFSMMDDDHKSAFDKTYIEDLYTKYMATGHVNEEKLNELLSIINGKSALIIAPGKSSLDEQDKVCAYASRDDVISFSVNFDYSGCDTDFIFLSNLRRYRELNEKSLSKCIVTSNIPAKGTYLQTGYKALTNNTEGVSDNAGLMLLRYLIRLGIKQIYIAGLDGYSVDPLENYADKNMAFSSNRTLLELMNDGMSAVITKMAKEVNIKFITAQRFVQISR